MIALFALLACRPDPPEKLLDTGWFEETGMWDGRCPHRHDATSPEAGVDDWYWRDVPRVFTTSAAQAEYDAYLIDADGVRLASELVWAEQSFEVVPAGPLAPDTEHTLRVVDCEGATDLTFRTSELGLPIAAGPASLQGRAYRLAVQEATWVEPGGVAPLLTLYFNENVLVGVPLVDASTLHLNLAVAGRDGSGNLVQYTDEPTTQFPGVSFGEAPFFTTSTPVVELVLSGARIPVYDFAFSGTFSADGARIGGGRFEGVGDTRLAGALLGDDDPAAVCVLAASLGVVCGPCPDGEPLCLPVRVEDIAGEWIPGFTIQAL